MTEIQCVRCGGRKEALPKAPLPGEPGELLHRGTCRDCWSEWLGEQVKLINELQMTPANPEHYDRLIVEMKKYLKLG